MQCIADGQHPATEGRSSPLRTDGGIDPLFYFHLHDGGERLPDHEGNEMSGAGAVPDAALLQARDVLAGDVRDGRLGLAIDLEVTDEQGVVIHRLIFADAVKIDWPANGGKSAKTDAVRRRSI